MANTNVPALEFTQSGVSVPSEADVLTGVLQDNNSAFGGRLNPALETPQGQLATTWAFEIAEKNAQIANIANQVNPDFSSGRWQDAIARIYFIDRIPAQGTVVQATCIGLPGVVIPVGALAKDSSGNLYSCTQAGTIPNTGTITLSFTCTTPGPIACPAGTLTTIYKAIPGWDTINNLTDGVVGNLVESRSEFEARRQASVAMNSHGSVPSVYGAVLNVPGVLDAYVTENTTNAPIVQGSTSVTLAPHSLYICVVGGLAEDIAAAIWSKKSLGCDYNGNTTVIVYDKDGYDYPYPQYEVKYQIPTAASVFFAVQLQANPNMPANVVDLVKDAITAAFNGTDGGTRARIGSTLVAGRYYAGIAAISPTVAVKSVLLGLDQPNLTSVTLGIDQTPTLSPLNITVTLG